MRLAKNHGKKSTKEGLTGLGYQITVPNGMHVKHDAGLYAMLEHNDFCKMMMMTRGIPLGDNGWLLKLCQIFFPKYLELVWQQFVKVVPKIFYFSICQIYEFVGCQQRSTNVSVLHRQQSTKSSSGRNDSEGGVNDGGNGNDENTQLKVAAKKRQWL